MAGLPWIRLDTGLPNNPKILGLIADRRHRAIVGYICALAWSGGQGTDGYLPRVALPYVHLDPVSGGWLEDANLLIPSLGGWVINDWAEYQQTTVETAERSAKAQAAARIRWDKTRNNGGSH